MVVRSIVVAGDSRLLVLAAASSPPPSPRLATLRALAPVTNLTEARGLVSHRAFACPAYFSKYSRESEEVVSSSTTVL